MVINHETGPTIKMKTLKQVEPSQSLKYAHTHYYATLVVVQSTIVMNESILIKVLMHFIYKCK